jgi:chromosome segregation ATPase
MNIMNKLTQRGITIVRLVEFIEQNIQLNKLGFTLDSAALLANELTRIDLNLIEAAVKLADLLSRQMSIEQEVGELQTKKSGLEQELKVKETEREGYNTQLELLKGQVKEITKLRADEERIHIDRQGQLAREIHNLEDKKQQIIAAIQERAEELGSTRKSLGQAAKSLKKMEEEVSKKRPLAVLARIIEEPKNELPAASVLESSLAFVQALCTYLYEHKSAISNYPEFFGLIGPVRRGLEDETRLV